MEIGAIVCRYCCLMRYSYDVAPPEGAEALEQLGNVWSAGMWQIETAERCGGDWAFLNCESEGRSQEAGSD